jgi:polyisoprenyl-phosphate glycosyltransferase
MHESPGNSFVILIPVYNDWTALGKLLGLLDGAIASAGLQVNVLIVDDGSSQPTEPDLIEGPFDAIGKVDILRLRRNLGHQRAIAIGLAYVEASIPCDAVVLMDGDGEDAPEDVPRLLARFHQEGGRAIVFAERTRRSESLSFQFFYQLYRAMHVTLTGVSVRVGNFSAIPRARLSSLVAVSELWNHYAASVFASRQPFVMIPTHRARRLDGRSSMNFTRLVIHGLSALSVFSDVIGVRMVIAASLLIVAGIVGLTTTVGVRLFTDLAIPGWATTAFGLLLVLLLQAVMFLVVFCFITLAGRNGSSFLPIRDYGYFVAGADTIYPRKA